jgi:cytoskeletal protein CcmA (bactofilin family)
MQDRIMDHLPELTYSMYVDRELADSERQRVERHLAECDRCHRLVAALQAENRVLVEVFRRIEEPASARSIGRSLLITVGSALGVAIGLDRLVVAVQGVIPGAGSWMGQFSLAWLQGLFFNNAFDLIREGPAMLNALVTVLGLVALGAILFGVLRHFVSRHPMSMALLAMTLLALAVPRPASAIERRQATKLRVASDETVRDSLIAQGDTIDIDGTIDGSLFVTGRRAVIRGEVKGDLFVFAQDTEVAGTVDGSIYAWASSLTVSGHVNQDVVVGANDVHIAGTVGRDVASFCTSVEVGGSIARNLQGYVGSAAVSKSARIGGNLEAHVKHTQDVDVESGATIAGKTQISTEKKETTASRYRSGHFYYWQCIWLAGALIVGLLLNWIAPGLFAARLESGGNFGWSWLIGFLVLVATPIAAVIACITLVGIPAGIIALVLWLISWIFLAKVFVGASVGRSLARRGASETSFVLALLAGLVVVFIAVNLPYLGGWLSFLLITPVGLGLGAFGVRSGMKRRPIMP